VQFVENDWQVDVLSASQTKQYGAQGYYGIPANVYAEERTEDSLLFAGATKGELDGSFIRTGIGLREFDHEYRIPSSSFTSEVLSRYGSLMIEGRTIEIQNIALNLRGDLEQEYVSGDIGQHDRTHCSMLILPEARFARFAIKAGLNSVFQTDESAEWLPLAGIDFFASDNLTLYASYAETVQQPDYQSLYYTGPYRSGNAMLKQQEAQSCELGLHQFISARLDWRAAVFQRRQKHAMDWTKATGASTSWTATDLGTLDVLGADAALNFRAADDLILRFYYQWAEKDDYPFYAGLYELDYPEQLLGFSGRWQVSHAFLLFADQTLRYQTANNVRDGNDFGADASLGLHYAPRFAKNVRLSFLVENLWGSNFQAIPGLKPRPASFFTGIAVTW
jgi:outer membrane cobalamin receptor